MAQDRLSDRERVWLQGQGSVDHRLGALNLVGWWTPEYTDYRCHRSVEIGIDHDVAEAMPTPLDLGLGQLEAGGDLRLRHPPATSHPGLQLVEARRHEEDGQSIRIGLHHLEGTVQLDIEQDVLPGAEVGEDLIMEGSVAITGELRPLQQPAGFDQLRKGLIIDEVVLDLVGLVRPLGAGSGRDGEMKAVMRR